MPAQWTIQLRDAKERLGTCFELLTVKHPSELIGEVGRLAMAAIAGAALACLIHLAVPWR